MYFLLSYVIFFPINPGFTPIQVGDTVPSSKGPLGFGVNMRYFQRKRGPNPEPQASEEDGYPLSQPTLTFFWYQIVKMIIKSPPLKFSLEITHCWEDAESAIDERNIFKIVLSQSS